MVVHADTCEPGEIIGYKNKTSKEYEGGLLKKKLGEKNVVVRHLDSADYVLYDADGHSLGIERKRGGDLVSSLSTKKRQANGNVRLLNQMVRMQAEYTNCALLLEGNQGMPHGPDGDYMWSLDGAESGWLWLSMQMMLWSWEQQEGFKIFYVPSMEATVELLRGLNNRAESGCVLKGIKVRKLK